MTFPERYLAGAAALALACPVHCSSDAPPRTRRPLNARRPRRLADHHGTTSPTTTAASTRSIRHVKTSRVALCFSGSAPRVGWGGVCINCRSPFTACCNYSGSYTAPTRWTARPADNWAFAPARRRTGRKHTHSPTTRGIAIGQGKSLCRHRRRAADCARPEDRQAAVGYEAAGSQRMTSALHPARHWW